VPGALGVMSINQLSLGDTCFSWYIQPDDVALDWIDSGFLDAAAVDGTAFQAAAARGAKLSVVAIPFSDIASNALVARDGLNMLADLRHKALWTTEGSNAHYMLLGALESASVDARDVTLKFATPAGITQAWSQGLVDAAWCSGGYAGHMLYAPHGDDGKMGHVVADAGDAATWGFLSVKVMVVSQRLLASDPDLVTHLVSNLMRTNWDYRASGHDRRRSFTPWAQIIPQDGRDVVAKNWAPGGAYLDALSAYTQLGRFYMPPAIVL